MATEIYDNYQTDGSTNKISIEVQTGFAQLYTTSVTLDGTPVVIAGQADPNGNYNGDFDIGLGSNAALKNILLEVTALATILMLPGSSSIIINLNGGAAPKQFTLNSPGANVTTGDVIKYYASISLT